jgi:signal transduction histidine kinase
MAFTWWSVLLFTKNRDAFAAKRELLRIGMIAEGLFESDQQFYQSTAYNSLYKEYKRQEWMIFGEAGVFVISLVIGVYLINRGYNKEMMATQQRRNFLLSITHELKSPIASIRLVLETFMKRDLPKDKLDHFSRNALKETERLNTLVNDLLLSAKLETAYQPHLEKLDLNALIEEIVQKLRTKYPAVNFRLQQKGNIPPITADKLGLTSVALNLMENAVKYAPESDSIDILLEQTNNHITFQIADQGTGIEDKDKKKIFEKFYRVGNEDTRKTKGTGLGLYIVSEIVKAHKGKITVKDNQPKGTLFSIELPLSLVSESEPVNFN